MFGFNLQENLDLIIWLNFNLNIQNIFIRKQITFNKIYISLFGIGEIQKQRGLILQKWDNQPWRTLQMENDLKLFQPNIWWLHYSGRLNARIRFLNCDGVVLVIYLNHKFQWPQEALNGESLVYEVVT